VVDGVDIEKDREIIKTKELVQRVKLTDKKLKEFQKSIGAMVKKNLTHISETNQVVVGENSPVLNNKDLHVIAESSRDQGQTSPDKSPDQSP
jgi:hypothetical protein